MPVAPGHPAQRHKAPPPPGGPPGYPGAGGCATARPAVGRSPTGVPGPAPAHWGLGAHHRVDGYPPDCRLLALGQNVAGPSRDGHRDAAAVSVDSHSPGGGGTFPVPGGVCGAQMPGAPTQGAPLLLPRYGVGTASRASPGPAHPPQGAPWGHGPSGATRPGDQPPTSAGPRDSPGRLVP